MPDLTHENIQKYLNQLKDISKLLQSTGVNYVDISNRRGSYLIVADIEPTLFTSVMGQLNAKEISSNHGSRFVHGPYEWHTIEPFDTNDFNEITVNRLESIMNIFIDEMPKFNDTVMWVDVTKLSIDIAMWPNNMDAAKALIEEVRLAAKYNIQEDSTYFSYSCKDDNYCIVRLYLK